MEKEMNYDRYLTIVVWGGRVLALTALFLPFGVFLAAVALMLAEAVGLLHRLYQGLRDGGE